MNSINILQTILPVIIIGIIGLQATEVNIFYIEPTLFTIVDQIMRLIV